MTVGALELGERTALDAPILQADPLFGARLPHPLFFLLVALALASLEGRARAEDVALTFDDLPTLTYSSSLDYAQTTTKALLRALQRRRWPATGFVNEIQLEGAEKLQRTALLEAWLDAGMDLGNHGYSHLSLTNTPVETYIADAARGETITRSLLAARGRTLRWYRHPYLETGPTRDVRKTFEEWLSLHGYRIAPVTMENADWMFALTYDDAVIRGDGVKAKRVKRAYLAYTAAVVPWYRKAAFHLLRRRPAFVFLLHATRLNADAMEGLSTILKQNRLRPVSLDKAMLDPAYLIQDAYVGPNGDEWVSRWSAALHKELPWNSFPEPPADMAAEDKRLDNSGDSIAP